MKENARNKGLEKKLIKETEFLEHIAYLIKEKKYSPYAVLQDLKKRDDCQSCSVYRPQERSLSGPFRLST